MDIFHMLNNFKQYWNNMASFFLDILPKIYNNKSGRRPYSSQFFSDKIVVGGMGSHNFHENILQECYKNPVAVGCINYLSSNLRRFQIQSNFKDFFLGTDIYILLENILNEWLLYGNCFLELQPRRMRKYDLSVLLTRKVHITHENEKITTLKYKDNHHTLEKELEKIIHLKNHNPFCEVYGISPINVVSNHILQYNLINNYLLDIASRGGLMSGIIFAKYPLENRERQQLQEQIL